MPIFIIACSTNTQKKDLNSGSLGGSRKNQYPTSPLQFSNFKVAYPVYLFQNLSLGMPLEF